MKKLTMIFALTLLLSPMAHAEKPFESTAECKDTINVQVNGLVCDFCARALEKVFGKQEEVSGVKVDLDNALVSVFMKPGRTMNDEKVTELITDSGYNVTEINKGC